MFGAALFWIAGVMAIPLYAGLIGFACLAFWVGAVYYNRSILSFFGMVFVFAVAVMAFQFEPFGYFLTHPWHVLGWVAAYALAGMIWGYGNWYVFMFKIRNALNGAPEDWHKTNRTITFDDFATEKLRNDGVLEYSEHWPIKVREHIGSISMWMAYWPASLIWTVLGDLLQTLYTRLVIWMSTLFQKIAARHDSAILSEVEKLGK